MVTNTLVTLLASAMSGVFNVFSMRGKEFKEGIAVFNRKNQYVGHSAAAGFKAVR